MVKRLLFILLCGFSGVTGGVFGQQVPHYHHYFINPMVYNPAATGLTYSTNAFFMRSHRNLGFEGGNIINVLTVDGSLWDNKVGLGLTMLSDEMGPTSTAGGFLSGSYKVKFSEKSFLRFGVTAGAKDYRVNFTQAVVQDPNDPSLVQGSAGRKIIPDVSAGLLFYASGFRIGVTGFQLIGSKIKYNGLVNENEISGVGGHTFARHIMANAQYDIPVAQKLSLFISPYATAKYVAGAPIYYEGGFTADFKRWGWINACYKADYGVTANLGVRIKQNLHIGYAYDVVINSSSSLAGLNQEILLGYTFPVKVNARDNTKGLDSLNAANEALRKQLAQKTRENDSLVTQNETDRRDAAEKFAQMEKVYLDSIAELNDLLKNRPVIKDTTSTANVKVDGMKRSTTGDHFLEMNNSESPYGLYTVYGAFSKFELADQALARVKKDFPEARLIFNERNQYRYVVLKYALSAPPVTQTRDKALSMGMEKAWILNYLK